MKRARILLSSFLSCLIILTLTSPLFAQVPFTLDFAGLSMDTSELQLGLPKDTGVFDKKGLESHLVYTVARSTAAPILIIRLEAALTSPVIARYRR
jgi:hypothetical protein